MIHVNGILKKSKIKCGFYKEDDMKQGEIYEEPSEKYQIEDYINSIYPNLWDGEYADGYNAALEMVLQFINEM